MRRIFTVLMATMILAIGSMAYATVGLLDWTLDLSSIGGPAAITNINSIGMNGSVHLIQAASGPGTTVVPGDAFSLTNAAPPLTPIAFSGVSYIDSALNTIQPMLAPGNGVLSVQSSLALTGKVVASALLPPQYAFLYDIPAAGVLTLDYLDPTNTNHVIADFTLLPTSGGISSDDFVSPTGFLSGTSNLYAVMNNILPGVFFGTVNSVPNTDLSTLPAGSVLANLSGIFNYPIPAQVNPLQANLSSNNNFTLGVSAIPEPTTMLLLGTGVLGLAFLRRRNKNG